MTANTKRADRRRIAARHNRSVARAEQLSTLHPLVAAILGYDGIQTEHLDRRRSDDRWCASCGEQGVPAGGSVCLLCKELQVEPFREGWD